MSDFKRDIQYHKFCMYGFLKNLRFFDAFFILFLVDKGLPYSQIGLLYAIREITINIFELPSGIIADTYGRKTSLIASFIVYIFSFVTFYIADELWLFMLAFILFGIADAFRSGTHKGMIMDYLKLKQWGQHKIKYYGYTRSWSQAGSAISSLIAGIIVFFSANYNSVFIYSIIPYLLNLLLIISYPNILDKTTKQTNKRYNIGLIETLKSFFRTIKQPGLIKIINTSATHSAFLKAVKDYIQPVMVHVAMLIPVMYYIDADKKNGLFIGIFYFIICLTSSRSSQLSSMFTQKHKSSIANITLFIGFISGILTGILYYKELWIPALITFTGIFIAENIRKPALTGFVADNSPNEVLTSVISAQSLLKTILTSLFALTFGVIAEYFNIGIALLSISSFLAVSAFIINTYTTKRR